jgi:CAAX protease family protein
MTTRIRDHQLITYYALAFGLSLGLGLLLHVSLAFGLLALFGPAAAAWIAARIGEGRPGVSALRAATTRWRVHPGWYLAAFALPVAGAAVGHLAYMLAGHRTLSFPAQVTPIMLLLFVLVIGEEIGWRGFLLRKLLERRSPLEATAIVAVAWALWHAPVYLLPGMPLANGSYPAFIVWIIPLTFLLTWLWLHTRSAWLAMVMHGAANLAGTLVFPLADPVPMFLFAGLGTALVALAVVVPSWRAFTTRPAVSPTPSDMRDAGVAVTP